MSLPRFWISGIGRISPLLPLLTYVSAENSSDWSTIFRQSTSDCPEEKTIH